MRPGIIISKITPIIVGALELTAIANIHNANIKADYTIVHTNIMILCILYIFSDALLFLIDMSVRAATAIISVSINNAYNMVSNDSINAMISNRSNMDSIRVSFFIFMAVAC